MRRKFKNLFSPITLSLELSLHLSHFGLRFFFCGSPSCFSGLHQKIILLKFHGIIEITLTPIGKRQTSDSSAKFLKLGWFKRLKLLLLSNLSYEQAVSVLLWKEHEVRNAIAVLRKTRTLASFTKRIRKFLGNSITHEWNSFIISIITTRSTLQRLIPRVSWRVRKKLSPSQKVKTRDFKFWLLCFRNFLKFEMAFPRP